MGTSTTAGMTLMALLLATLIRTDHLAEELLSRLTYRGGVHVGHCRVAPQGCEARVAEILGYIDTEAKAQGLPVPLVAALAWEESRLHPFAVGTRGSLGVMQVHPADRRVRRASRFLRSRRWREQCRRVLGGCQRSVVAVGTAMLRRAWGRCGNLLDALRAYNSGRCTRVRTSLPRRVVRTWGELIGAEGHKPVALNQGTGH